MDCTHCSSFRIAHREIMDRFGLDRLPRWGEREDVDDALGVARQQHSDAGSAQCPCDCHTSARIVGTLPRLVTP